MPTRSSQMLGSDRSPRATHFTPPGYELRASTTYWSPRLQDRGGTVVALADRLTGLTPVSVDRLGYASRVASSAADERARWSPVETPSPSTGLRPF
jgi:hypothetical protein